METDPREVIIDILGRGDGRIYYTEWGRLRPAERTLLLVWELEVEVNNGGFIQYFDNPSGEHTQLLVEGLVAIGAGQAALLAEAAIARMPGGLDWSDWNQRCDAIDLLSEEAVAALADLDRRYATISDDVVALLLRHVERNAVEFYVGSSS